MARAKRGRFAAALADCNAAIQHDPDDLDAYRARGAVYVGCGQYESALEDLDWVLADDDDDVATTTVAGPGWGWANLGKPSPILQNR